MRVRVDFESGSLADWEVLGPGHLRVAARADRSPRPLWFYFQVEDLDTAELRVELANAADCLGPRHGWQTARPVYRPLSEVTCWQRSPAGHFEGDRRRGTFRFSVPHDPERSCGVAVAYCYPYTVSDLKALQERTAGWEAVGRSAEGRRLTTASFGTPGAPAVWVLARQHAGESPASFALEGLCDELRGPGEAALGGAAFRVVPMVDPDGVVHGRYGKDSAPVDFNRDWTDAPRRPEIRAITRAVEATARRSPPALLLDLHASHHGDTSCYLFGTAEQARGLQARFLELLAEQSPAAVGFRPSDLRAESPPPGSARDYFARRYGALSLCVELSYHLAQSGRYLTPADYRDFGAALARSAVKWVGQWSAAARG